MAPVLYVSGVVAGYVPDVPIVRGATVEVAAGEIVTILGPNGAGKSTLVKAIAGLVSISAGSVLLGGQDVTGTPAYAVAGLGIGYVPQTENVFTTLSVHDNLRVSGPPSGADTRAAIERMFTLFPDLAERRRHLGRELSGGQRQMLAFARALMRSPRVLMPDEPSAGLSPKMVGVVFEKLRELAATGVAVLMVEQNAKAALRASDRGVVLVEGKERLVGKATDLLEDPRLGQLYLGRIEEAA
jgi:branched-chain amino acid transport system ATP-binding protein